MTRFEIRRSDSGYLFYYVLVAANGRILVTSNFMTSVHNCRNGIRALMNLLNARLTIRIDDLSDQEDAYPDDPDAFDIEEEERAESRKLDGQERSHDGRARL